MGRYLFEDTELAAQRLERLAVAYAPYSRDFIRSKVSCSPELALDLGCGPGYTTRLLAEATGSQRAVGLDKSTPFIERAQRGARDGVAFLTHDLTDVPFPVGPADLIYCRLVLAHCRDPLGLVERWGSQLKPGGRLLLEEMEWIRCDQPLFTAYLDIVVAMLADEGYDMYAGPHLAQHSGASTRLRTVSNDVGEVPLSTHVVAELFHMNIQTWKGQPFIRANYDARLIDDMERELANLRDPAQGGGDVVWGMRRMVMEKK